MKTLCAWCLEEGQAALIGEKEPLEDCRETHGICDEHRRELEDEYLTRRRAPDILDGPPDP